MRYEYTPFGVCPAKIAFDLEDGVLHNVEFLGGCNGNLKAISKVVEGKTPEEVNELFSGIQCGMKGTSCSDQLARAVMDAAENE